VCPYDDHAARVGQVVAEDGRGSAEKGLSVGVECGSAVGLFGRGVGVVDRWGLVADLGWAGRGHLALCVDTADAEAASSLRETSIVARCSSWNGYSARSSVSSLRTTHTAEGSVVVLHPGVRGVP